MSIEYLISRQNRDGGWPYSQGVSWTEPTVLAVLAAQAANRPDAAARGAAWLRRMQRADGGFAPQGAVEESTWVTGLAALLPPGLLGIEQHARAISWLRSATGKETTLVHRVRQFLLGNTGLATAEESAGWPWLPGTSAWVGPTVFGILAFRREQSRNPQPGLAERIDLATRYLLSHICGDGGWNHGASAALGYEAPSYPETTGMALLGLAGVTSPQLPRALQTGREFLARCQSADGQNWLRLGLAAHQQLPPDFTPRPLPARNLRDVSIALLADSAAVGRNLFL